MDQPRGESEWLCDGDAALLLFLDDDVGRQLVETHAEAFQFLLDNSFVGD